MKAIKKLIAYITLSNAFRALCVIAVLLAADLAGQVINFTNNHTIVVRSPLQTPIVISAKAEQVVQAAAEPVVYLSEQDELKDYVSAKFGKDAPIALAIMQAESHGNAEALHVNGNETADFGCMQINSIHLVKGVK